MNEPQQELDLQERWLEYDPDTYTLTIDVSEAMLEDVMSIEVCYVPESDTLKVTY